MRGRLVLLALISLVIAIPAYAAVMFIPVPMYMGVREPRVNIGDVSNFHNVAVLSAIGSGLRLGKKNFLFKEGGKVLKIDDWNVDDQVVTTVQQLFGNRFQFKSVSYDRAALAALPNGKFDNSRTDLQKYLGVLPRDGLDAFIVVRPALSSDGPGAGGLSVENDADDKGRTAAFANYEIYIVDAQTLRIVSVAYSRVQQRPGYASYAGFTLVKELTYDEKTMDLTSDQRKAYRAIYYRLIPLSLVETLRSLQTGAKLPSIGGRSLVPRSADKRVYDQIKSVAVISTVGDDFLLQHFGDSYITSSTDHIKIDDWHIDDVIETQARAAVGTQFEIKDVAVDKDEVRSSSLLDDKLAYNPVLHGLSPRDDVDAYLVVLKHPFDFRGSRTRGKGFGMVRFAQLLSADTFVFAYYDVALIDAHTLKVLRANSAVIDPAYTLTSPSRTVQNALWPDSAEKITAKQKEEVRAEITRLINWSLKETLLRMNLTNMMIVDSWPLPTENAMEIETP